MRIKVKCLNVKNKNQVLRVVHFKNIRDKQGRSQRVKTYQLFKYIGEQMFKHAHGQDIRRKSNAELDKKNKIVLPCI